MSSPAQPEPTETTRPTGPTPPTPTTKQGDDLLAVLIDLALIYLFAYLGRASHAEALGFTDVANVALPFWVGALIGHVVVRYTHHGPRKLAWGALILLSTWAIGHAGRYMVDGSFDWAFLGVSAAFLTLFLLGWRVALLGWLRFRAGRTSSRT